MMTEEDTIRKLKKLLFEEMLQLWLKMPATPPCEQEKYFTPYGWTFNEFILVWGTKAMARGTV